MVPQAWASVTWSAISRTPCDMLAGTDVCLDTQTMRFLTATNKVDRQSLQSRVMIDTVTPAKTGAFGSQVVVAVDLATLESRSWLASTAFPARRTGLGPM